MNLVSWGLWALGVLAMLALAGAALGLRPDLPRAAVLAAYTMRDSRFITLHDGSVAHVRIAGAGPPLVLLHGFSSSAWAWDGWTQALADRRQIIRIDAPGHGLTRMAPDADVTPDGQTGFVAEVLDKLGLEKVAIGGNSMGGAQALRFAAQRPDRVEALILVDAAGPSSERVKEDLSRVRRAAANPVLRFALLQGGGRIVMAEALRSGVADKASISPDQVRRTDDLYRVEGNRRTLLRILEAAGDPTADLSLSAIRAPTLVMQGGKDRIVPPDVARTLAAGIPGARLLLYPDLGHTPHEESAARTAADAGAFLDALATRPPGP